MHILSAIARQEKNKLHTDSVFLLLLDIVPNVKDAEVLRVCYNNEDITWAGNLYPAFPFQLGKVSEDSTGSEPGLELKVDNVSRALQPYVEQYNGGNGFTVILRMVNSKNLDGTDPDVEERFVVNHCVVDAQYITFTLGSGYPLNTRRPMDRYLKNNCPYQYKDIRCGCTSNIAACGHTLTECRARGNSPRFGGYVGIDQKGIYLNG